MDLTNELTTGKQGKGGLENGFLLIHGIKRNEMKQDGGHRGKPEKSMIFGTVAKLRFTILKINNIKILMRFRREKSRKKPLFS